MLPVVYYRIRDFRKRHFTCPASHFTPLTWAACRRGSGVISNIFILDSYYHFLHFTSPVESSEPARYVSCLSRHATYSLHHAYPYLDSLTIQTKMAAPPEVTMHDFTGSWLLVNQPRHPPSRLAQTVQHPLTTPEQNPIRLVRLRLRPPRHPLDNPQSHQPRDPNHENRPLGRRIRRPNRDLHASCLRRHRRSERRDRNAVVGRTRTTSLVVSVRHVFRSDSDDLL